MMQNGKQTTGKRGEQEACNYLLSLGHTIVARNWRSAHLELDIITLLGDELHIVEVKSRTAPVMAAPEVNVNRVKQERLVRGAKAFLHSAGRRSLPADLETVFDVITVVFGDGTTEIEYYPKAFTPIYV